MCKIIYLHLILYNKHSVYVYKSYSTYIDNVTNGDLMPKSTEKIPMQQITLKLKVDDLNRLKEYANKKGGNPVSHYIREAVAEFLDKHQ